MRKFIYLFALLGMLFVPAFASPNAFCITPKGELLGTINQLEAQGFTLTNIQCTPVNYLVAPEPPYLNSIITVTMRKIECPTPSGPCFLLGTAFFTAEEIVQNNQGATRQTNVSNPIIAL